MGGFAVRSNDGHIRRLHPQELVASFHNGDLDWPEVSDEEIDDRSKATWLVKSFALMQMIWFITQLIGRWAQGLAATTLELFTLGIVLCAIVIYLACLGKPFDVQMPVVLETGAVRLKYDTADRVNLIPGFTRIEGVNSVWNNSAIILISLLFGAVHVAAWDFHFPTATEQLLWRIASIGVTILPVLLVIGSSMCVDADGPQFGVLNIIYIGVYTISRLYMFVEMFVSLRAVPVSVYQTPQWSQYFPSFG
jgi:hypothetical protein